MDEALALYKEGKINDWEFHTYMLFLKDDLGQNYLKNAIESVFLETPPPVGNFAYARHEGRLSVWREIKQAIIGVNNLIEGKNYDGSSRSNNPEPGREALGGKV